MIKKRSGLHLLQGGKSEEIQEGVFPAHLMPLVNAAMDRICDMRQQQREQQERGQKPGN